jgi:cell division protein FtsB
MSTRLKRPSFWRQLFVGLALVAFQGYLIYNVVEGQFGIASQKEMHKDIEQLEARKAALAAEVESYRHRVELFSSDQLDPDILTERARALLAMTQPDDLVIMVDPRSGKPLRSSSVKSTDDQLSDIIADSAGN